MAQFAHRRVAPSQTVQRAAIRGDFCPGADGGALHDLLTERIVEQLLLGSGN